MREEASGEDREQHSTKLRLRGKQESNYSKRVFIHALTICQTQAKLVNKQHLWMIVSCSAKHCCTLMTWTVVLLVQIHWEIKSDSQIWSFGPLSSRIEAIKSFWESFMCITWGAIDSSKSCNSQYASFSKSHFVFHPERSCSKDPN